MVNQVVSVAELMHVSLKKSKILFLNIYYLISKEIVLNGFLFSLERLFYSQLDIFLNMSN
jgi:hypothetical protein